VSAVRVVVLYEDKPADAPKPGRGSKEFGLHHLVVAMVADRMGVDANAIRRTVDGRPLGPNSRVLEHFRRADVYPAQLVVGVFDGDEVRRLVGLKGDANEEDVRSEILRGVDSPDLRCVVFLDRNVESVLRHAIECLGGVGAELARDAIDRKQRNERDIVLKRAAYAQIGVRACVEGKHPELMSLADRITSALA